MWWVLAPEFELQVCAVELGRCRDDQRGCLVVFGGGVMPVKAETQPLCR